MTLTDALAEALGPDCVRLGDAIPARNRQDAAGYPPVVPRALVLPRDTAGVAAALRLCHAAGQPVVVQGGLTGLAGGGHPQPGEVALSLERLRGVAVDPDTATLTARAGTPLAEVQAAAEAAGFLCGIDLGARGSCSIGGNVATNAGGNQVLRYGMARRNVLGLEIVKPDGTVLSGLNRMLKNNAGYDWTQIYIGSEGTLGVITEVVLQLHARPRAVRTAMVALPGMPAALALLRALDDAFPGGLLVFEGMWREFFALGAARLGMAEPFAERPELAALIELSDPEGAAEDFLAAQLDAGVLADALVAQSGADRARLWAWRKCLSAGCRRAAVRGLRRVDSARAHRRGGGRSARCCGGGLAGRADRRVRAYRRQQPACHRADAGRRSADAFGGRGGLCRRRGAWRVGQRGTRHRRRQAALAAPVAQPGRAATDARAEGGAGPAGHPQPRPRRGHPVSGRMRVTPGDIAGVVGILPAPSTPDAGHWSCAMSVDLDSAAAMTAMVADAGITALMTGGSFGEGPSLTEDEHVALAACVADTLAGRGMLFAGATAPNTRDTIARGRRLVAAGATGLFLGRPYWMALDQPGILAFYRDVAEALPGVPVVVYDNPFAFKGRIAAETYAALAAIPEVVATKDIGGPTLAADMLAAGPRMRVLPADSQWPALAEAHPDLATACWTGMCANGPEPLAALAAAVAGRDWPLARRIGDRMAWAQAAMFPGGRLEAFVDYNVPIAHGRLQGSGRVRTGPPRPPFHLAPEGHVEGGRETGRRWRALCAEFPLPLRR